MSSPKWSSDRLVHGLSRFLLWAAPALYAVSFYLLENKEQLARQGWHAAGYLSFFVSWLCLLIWFVRQGTPKPDTAKVEFAWKTILIPFVLLMLAAELGIRLI